MIGLRRRLQTWLVMLILLGAAILSPALAVPTTCGAEDLLARMKTEQPEAYKRVQSAARAVPNGDGLLWKISKGSTAPSYLFGTMHSTDPRLDRQINRLRPLIARSRSLAVEVSELVTPGLREKAAQDIARAGLARSGNALEGLTPQSNRAVVETLLARRGLTLDRAQRFETWFLIVALSSPQCERERRALGLINVDEKIGAEGVKAGLTPIGLERLEDQIEVLKRIGGINPSMALISIAHAQKEIADMRETMTQAYLRDNLGEVAALSRLQAVLQGESATLGHDAFSRALLDSRNTVMRDAMLPLLERGGAFVAVGALHLPGENGLVRLLQDVGYRVTSIPLKHNGK